MKVMTNQMEARGLQSRTEVRQTVAQMAAPNFKDSVPEDSLGQVMIFPQANSYFAPGKLGLCSVQTRTLLRAKSRFASGKLLARRAAMLLILMIGMVGSAWGQTFNTAGTMVSGGVEKDVYLDVLSQRTVEIDVKDYIDVIRTSLNSLGGSYSSTADLTSQLYLRWSLLDGANAYATNITQSDNQWGTSGLIGFSSSDNTYAVYNTGISGRYWFKNVSYWSSASIPTITLGLHYTQSLADFSDYTIVCYI